MAQDMFLKLTDIEAESKDKVYGKNIDILAWSWGASQSATMHVGGGGGGGKVSMQDVSCTKYIDKSTPILFKHCCTGVHIPKGELIVRKAGGKPVAGHNKAVNWKKFGRGVSLASARKGDVVVLRFRRTNKITN